MRTSMMQEFKEIAGAYALAIGAVFAFFGVAAAAEIVSTVST